MIPNNLAIEASKKNINVLNAKNESIERSESQNRELALETAKKLEKELLTFKVKENSGKLFGSITTSSIYDELIKLGYEINKKNINLKKPINMLGSFKVKIKLYNNVFTEVSIEVKPI